MEEPTCLEPLFTFHYHDQYTIEMFRNGRPVHDRSGACAIVDVRYYEDEAAAKAFLMSRYKG